MKLKKKKLKEKSGVAGGGGGNVEDAGHSIADWLLVVDLLFPQPPVWDLNHQKKERKKERKERKKRKKGRKAFHSGRLNSFDLDLVES